MTEQRWYVVAGGYYYADEHPAPEDEIWTVSREPDRAGWNTEGGHAGYGLTKAQADELADAANSAPHQPGRDD